MADRVVKSDDFVVDAILINIICAGIGALLNQTIPFVVEKLPAILCFCGTQEIQD